MPTSQLGLDDVIVQMKRRRTIGACYVLRTAHGPDQLFFLNRTGIVGGLIPREDVPYGPTKQVFPRAT
jgi:hypothetical protein